VRRIESKINSSRLRALSLDIVRAMGKTPIRGVWPMALADGMVGGLLGLCHFLWSGKCRQHRESASPLHTRWTTGNEPAS
jgi:hypothetical protein